LVDFGASHTTHIGCEIEGADHFEHSCTNLYVGLMPHTHPYADTHTHTHTNLLALRVSGRFVGLGNDRELPHMSADT
jgi:hypothetical protein